MKKNTLTQNAIFSVLHKILNVLFPLITYMYVARVLLPNKVGQVSAVQNNVSYFLILASLGVPAYGVREVAKARENKKKLNCIYSELLLINAFFTTLAIIAFAACFFFLKIFDAEKLLYLIYAFSIVLNYINVDWLYQGEEEYQYIAVRSMIIKTISIILILVFVKKESDIYVYSIINVLSVSGNYIFNIIHSKKYVKLSMKGIELNRHIKPLVYLALCTISTELYARMDITMINTIKNATEVGYYTYAHRAINIVITFLVAITSVFLPRLSYFFQRNQNEFVRLLKIGMNLMLFISIPAFACIFILSKYIIIILFGSRFVNAYKTLSILSLMIPLKCVGDVVCYQVMMAAGKESILMKSYFIVMVVNFFNNLLLIPRFGTQGAAIASVISEILAFVFVFYHSKKIIIIKIAKKNIICMAIATLFLVLTIEICKCINNIFLKTLFSVLFGIIIYIATNYLLKNQFLIDFTLLLKSKFVLKRK